jgi:HEAT repeats
MMKHFTKIFVLTVFIILVSTSAFAGEKEAEVTLSERTIVSLLIGLDSENAGLISSCAYMLGEFKVTEAIIPLMRILHNDENEELRISAALALYKIGTPIAIFAVKQAGRFDESKRVNKLAQSFYFEYLRDKLGKENQEQSDSLIAQGK